MTTPSPHTVPNLDPGVPAANEAAGQHSCCAHPNTLSTSRRALLRGAAIVGGTLASSAAFGSAFVERSFAATGTSDSVLVVLSMRGACDGLSLMVPHANRTYYSARPRTSIARNALWAQDSTFGLHPALKPLEKLWNAGSMAAVAAVGLPAPNRSHFAAMEEIEDADPGSTTRVGWLNRLIGRNGTPTTPLNGMMVGTAILPASLSGPEPALSTETADAVTIRGSAHRDTALRTLWANQTGQLGSGYQDAVAAVDGWGPVARTSTPNAAAYPNDSDLADALSDTARIIRADVGAEVITVDHGSWDTHTNMGSVDAGAISNLASEFATCIAAFFDQLGPLASKVTVVTLSEFGRRVAENGSGGTDHGWGTVSFAFGAGVKGGYYGTLPQLNSDPEADVAITTDYRSVLAEVATRRFDVSSATLFPGFNPKPVGLMRAA